MNEFDGIQELEEWRGKLNATVDPGTAIITNARKVRETLGAAGDEGETALLIDETAAAVEKLCSSLGKML